MYSYNKTVLEYGEICSSNPLLKAAVVSLGRIRSIWKKCVLLKCSWLCISKLHFQLKSCEISKKFKIIQLLLGSHRISLREGKCHQ
jgi:hypothetical protein